MVCTKWCINYKALMNFTLCVCVLQQNVPVVQDYQLNSLVKINKIPRVPLLDVQPASGISKVVIDCKQPSLAHRFWQVMNKFRT